MQASETNRDAEDLEVTWKGLKDCLLQVTEEVCGRTKSLTRHTATWWWNQDVAKLVEENEVGLRFGARQGLKQTGQPTAMLERLQAKRYMVQSSGDRAKEVWS